MTMSQVMIMSPDMATIANKLGNSDRPVPCLGSIKQVGLSAVAPIRLFYSLEL